MGEQTSEKGKNLHMIIITHRGRSLKMLAKFVPLMTTYLPLVDIGEGIPFLLFTRENLHTVDIFSTTYIPLLANIVKERPLSVQNNKS